MRLIDADALMKRHLPNCIGKHDENESKSFNFFYGYNHAVSGIREVLKAEPTVDAIPVDTLKAWMNAALADDDIPMIHSLNRLLKRWERQKDDNH